MCTATVHRRTPYFKCTQKLQRLAKKKGKLCTALQYFVDGRSKSGTKQGSDEEPAGTTIDKNNVKNEASLKGAEEIGNLDAGVGISELDEKLTTIDLVDSTGSDAFGNLNLASNSAVSNIGEGMDERIKETRNGYNHVPMRARRDTGMP